MLTAGHILNLLTQPYAAVCLVQTALYTWLKRLTWICIIHHLLYD